MNGPDELIRPAPSATDLLFEAGVAGAADGTQFVVAKWTMARPPSGLIASRGPEPYMLELAKRVNHFGPLLARGNVLEIRRDDNEESAREHAANAHMIAGSIILELAELLEAATSPTATIAPLMRDAGLTRTLERIRGYADDLDRRVRVTLELLEPPAIAAAAPPTKTSGMEIRGREKRS